MPASLPFSSLSPRPVQGSSQALGSVNHGQRLVPAPRRVRKVLVNR